jgi:calcineurin-like phosphoesterase family protein
MKVLFTSDQHFGHRNIMRFTNRRFPDTAKMDEELIRRHNSVVKPNDVVYMLGDFTFYRREEDIAPLISRMNGEWIGLLGNHDEKLENLAGWRFKELHGPHLEIKIGKRRIVLNHYPLAEWNGSFRGSWHLHGHAHNQWPQTKYKRLDVGADSHDLRPWTLNELDVLMSTRIEQGPEIYNPPA